LIDHGERYDRMEEFIAVCKALWSSVDADAFIWDRLNGLERDPVRLKHNRRWRGNWRILVG
jgi:alkanesulfonate monooxygenase SsuD/methylene tetrahydromethanopterin reductase-like flavin-dependent oxidoreductase (luciferase family)